MTYREKLKQEHPDKVEVDEPGGCRGCPKDYSYGPEYAGNALCRFVGQSTDVCRECWDTEISGKETTDMNYTNAAVRQLIMAAFFNAVNGADVKSLDYIRGVSAMADAMIELIMQDEEGGNE